MKKKKDKNREDEKTKLYNEQKATKTMKQHIMYKNDNNNENDKHSKMTTTIKR